MHQLSDQAASRNIAVFVNLAKFVQLAALTPPIVTGIAQRATQFGGAEQHALETAALVTTTATIGSICAIIGALSFGALSDMRLTRAHQRWYWVALGSAIGAAGLVTLSFAASVPQLIAGWSIAQLGFSGSMAVLRTILGSALTSQRRRGAVFLVLGGYGGMSLALVALMLMPSRIWETTLGFAALSLAIPFIFLASVRRIVPPQEAPAAAPSAPSIAGPAQLSRGFVLLVQGMAGAVLAAFVTYHPLDVVERVGATGDAATRLTVGVLIAAAIGLIAASIVLLVRPTLLANARRVLIFTGVSLAASLALRAVDLPIWAMLLTAALSGFAVGVNSSALLATALEHAPAQRSGRYIGTFSAVGVLGQLAGPILGLSALAVMEWSVGPSGSAPVRMVFAWLAVLPLVWAIIAAAHRSKRVRATVQA
ncbi:MFS family permease [Leucobacter exalbidus]|uniref:MFS family permease n=1 Tax=Leucobacter exalbidus TaxID=662960 RepID=A0A940PMG9_9MICO|nr:hypothetical protein [Leucobacter exalbidus]MBP1326647.1 MFS family permease [Leucobacter exalbidus]